MSTIKTQSDMKTCNSYAEGGYVSPAAEIYELTSEGVICASGTHESLTEDDSWQDLFE